MAIKQLPTNKQELAKQAAIDYVRSNPTASITEIGNHLKDLKLYKHEQSVKHLFNADSECRKEIEAIKKQADTKFETEIIPTALDNIQNFQQLQPDNTDDKQFALLKEQSKQGIELYKVAKRLDDSRPVAQQVINIESLQVLYNTALDDG